MSARDAILQFHQAVSESPFRLAPEAAERLLHEVMEGDPYEIDFEGRDTNFYAFPKDKVIRVSASGLLSVWACGYASMLILEACFRAQREHQSVLSTGPGTGLNQALRMIEAAENLIHDPNFEWPCDLPVPNAGAEQGTLEGCVNNIFLASVGWILLHEIAHVYLKHEVDTVDALRMQQEFEADKWASNWILGLADRPLMRSFRLIGIVSGCAWIGLIDKIKHGSTTHPHASNRLGQMLSEQDFDELDAGLEGGSYILKVIFDPHGHADDFETPSIAFFEHLFTLKQSHSADKNPL